MDFGTEFSLQHIGCPRPRIVRKQTQHVLPRAKLTTISDVIVVGGGPGGIVSATKFAEAGLNTLLLEHGGPMLWRDGNREVPAWTQEEYPNNTLTRHDGMIYYLAPSNVNYFCTNLPSGLLAACQLGGGTSVNAMQQWWPPQNYLKNAFGFEGWRVADFEAAIQRTVKRIPYTPYWSSDNKVRYG